MSFAAKLILDPSGLTFSLPLPAPLEFGSLAVMGGGVGELLRLCRAQNPVLLLLRPT